MPKTIQRASWERIAGRLDDADAKRSSSTFSPSSTTAWPTLRPGVVVVDAEDFWGASRLGGDDSCKPDESGGVGTSPVFTLADSPSVILDV